MPSMTGKTFTIAGVQVGLATDAERAARLRRNRLYRYMIRPMLSRVARNGNGRSAGPAPTISLKPSQVAPPATPEALEVWDRIKRLRWYHTIELPHGVVTPGFIDNRPTKHLFGLPADLTGKRCLDIGTYDGFWAFEMERRGASDVVAIDIDSPAEADIPRLYRQQVVEEARAQEERMRQQWDEKASSMELQWPGDGFRLAKEILGSGAERVPLNVYQLSPERVGMFDVVIISQLLLRLRDPQTVLENMFSVTRGFAIVAEPYDAELERLERPASEFIGTAVLGAWWSHSIKSMTRIMQVAGFDPVEEVARFRADNRAGTFDKVILKGYAPASNNEHAAPQSSGVKEKDRDVHDQR